MFRRELLLTVLILLNRSLLVLETLTDATEESRFSFDLPADDDDNAELGCFLESFETVDFRSDVEGGFNDCERFSSLLTVTGFLGIFFKLLIEAEDGILFEVVAVDGGGGDGSCLIEIFGGDLTVEVDVDSGLIDVFPGSFVMVFLMTT